MDLKKHTYGTVIVDLENGKVIDLLNTRNPIEVQEELNKYDNLDIVSRDRRYSYRSLSKDYTHIADRFHLVKKLSDAIIKEIKKTLPRQINLDDNLETIKSTLGKIKEKEYSPKQIEKQKLIRKIKEEYSKGRKRQC